MIEVTLKILVPFGLIMNIIPLLIWLERKGAAYIQDRRGPNRASIGGFRLGGLVHSLNDVVKLLTKEDVIPPHVNAAFYVAAPMIAMSVACLTFAVLPFGESIRLANGALFSLQAADIDAGIMYLFAMGSLGVYAVMLAGWSSNNKYSLLGGLRASAQMVSYEIALSLSVISVLLFAGTLEFNGIIQDQGPNMWSWNFVRMPISCVIFIAAVFAETNRLPFDLAEGEAELVAGFHTEYSSMKFALFFMAEYAHMIIGSAVIVCLFFGGWQVPFLATETLRSHAHSILYYGIMATGLLKIVGAYFLFKKKQPILWKGSLALENKRLGLAGIFAGMALVLVSILLIGKLDLGALGSQIVVAVLQASSFLVKVLFFCWVFIWVRWTLPRFRYDQLMNLGWKYILPVSLVNIVFYAAIKLAMVK